MNKLQQARARLLLKNPFFGTLVVTTPLVPLHTIPTAATDMVKIYYNPDFFASLTVDEIEFVLAHEVLHMALLHGFRLGGRVHSVWNKAADYAINLTLKLCGFTLVRDVLYDTKWKGMSAEIIYDKLASEQPDKKPDDQGNPSAGQDGQDGQGGQDDQSGDQSGDQDDQSGGQSGGQGDPIPGLGSDIMPAAYGSDPAEQASRMREIQQRVAQATNVARMAGKLPAELERQIMEVLDPQVPWTDMLREYMLRSVKDDESWSRRNRRFGGVYLPSRYTEAMGEVVLIGDTSGSMGQRETDQIAAEVNAIRADLNPERIRVVWADADVSSEQVFEQGEDVHIKPTGGGGTDMRAPLRHVEEYDPVVVILMTDGYTPWPDVEPPYPLIVCCSTDTNVPFGDVVRVAC